MENEGTEKEGSLDVTAQAGYSSWRQVSGYFDGDGNVGLEVVKRVLRIKIRFVDTWRPQIESVLKFLRSHRVRTGNVGRDVKGAWQPAYRLDITEVASVLKAARAMLRFTVKKNEDLKIAVEYLEGRMTGNEAIRAFNQEVRSGRRRGKIREQNIPYTREEGLRLTALENARRARAAYAVVVSDETQRQVRGDHQKNGLSFVRLSRKYGYSVSVIRRVLGKK